MPVHIQSRETIICVIVEMVWSCARVSCVRKQEKRMKNWKRSIDHTNLLAEQLATPIFLPCYLCCSQKPIRSHTANIVCIEHFNYVYLFHFKLPVYYIDLRSFGVVRTSFRSPRPDSCDIFPHIPLALQPINHIAMTNGRLNGKRTQSW